MAYSTEDLQSTIKSFFKTISMELNETRNSQRENILHFACKLNKSRQIETLINIGCRLTQQDINGRTPLHIAIEMKHQETLEIFRKLFKTQNMATTNPGRYKRLQEDLKKLFRIYDHYGYTVLHKAVLYNMTDLVKDMLKFCKRCNINVADIEVLGCGDSILHLAVKENHLEMSKIIYDNLPKMVKLRNYGGEKPIDIFNITMEMKVLLQMDLKT